MTPRSRDVFELPPDVLWLEPWHPLDDAEACRVLRNELYREMPSDHVLEGLELRAVARSDQHPDDVLFVTSDPARPIAFVHLTWTLEHQADWPFTVVYATLDEWLAAMREEHEEWRTDDAS